MVFKSPNVKVPHPSKIPAVQRGENGAFGAFGMKGLSRAQLSDKSTKAFIASRVADCDATLYLPQRLFHAAVRSEDCFYIRSRCGLGEAFHAKALEQA
jgi:hypothetical protein